MSDIRFNQWLHQSGTGGVSQVDGGHVGIGTTNPDIAVHTANAKKLNVGIVTANSIFAGNFYGNGSNLTGIGDADKIIEGDTKLEVVDAGSAYIVGEVNGTERLRITSGGQIQLPVNGQQLTWGASQQMKFYYENSEDRMYLQGDGAYGFAFRVNGGNRIEINKTTGDVTMQGSGNKNFLWDNSAADLYLTDSGSGESAKLKIGTDADLKIYHDCNSNNSYVTHDNGSGHLYLQGDAIKLRTRSATNNEVYINCSHNAQVELYHNNSKKLETTSTGIQITSEEPIIKLYDESNPVYTRRAIANDLGNTASNNFTVPSCFGGGTVTVVGLSNGNHTISTTKQYAIQINGTGTATLGNQQFSINGSGGAWSYSVSATNQGVSVTNNGGAFGRFRVTFDITAYES